MSISDIVWYNISYPSNSSSNYIAILILPPPPQTKLPEGNVFTRVCVFFSHSVCWGGVPMWELPGPVQTCLLGDTSTRAPSRHYTEPTQNPQKRLESGQLFWLKIALKWKKNGLRGRERPSRPPLDPPMHWVIFYSHTWCPQIISLSIGIQYYFLAPIKFMQVHVQQDSMTAF